MATKEKDAKDAQDASENPEKESDGEKQPSGFKSYAVCSLWPTS